MADSADSFVYDKLPPGRWFRLLHLYPGRPDEPLACSLSSHELASSPPFKAISYTWGDAKDMVTITCCGYSKCVTRNLYLALRRIRSIRQSITLWVDSICIDQSDKTEKGHQVDLFSTIYKEAEEVIIWLGGDSESSAQLAFETITNINTLIPKTASEMWPGQPLDTLASVRLLYTRAFTLIKDEVHTILNTRSKYCIKTLYGLPYFTRIWVLQEVGLARHPTAIWGDAVIDFSHIAMFMYLCTSLMDLKLELGDAVTEIVLGRTWTAFRNIWCTYGEDTWTYKTPVLRLLSQWATQNMHEFLSVLDASKHFQAAVSLDHVYALLGHPLASIPGSAEPLLFADYTLDTKALNQKLISKLTIQSLNFLAQVRRLDQQDQPCVFPSWLPQWDTHHNLGPNAFWEFWDASLRKDQRRKFEYSITGDQLHVTGILFDLVYAQTAGMKEEDLSRPEGLGAILKECWLLSNITTTESQTIYDDNFVALTTSLTAYFQQYPVEERVAALEDMYSECGVSFSERIGSRSGEAGRTVPSSELKSIVKRQIQLYSANRRFFITKKGYCGIGPVDMRTGDVCAVLFGVDVPLIIRRSDQDKQYTLVGECYIHGIMYGEAVLQSEEPLSGMEESNIIII
ncbi:heterokaryon incompatibility protein-domain-containing protein [Nemania sp. FL0916]|nr:heterokaryon incompatibility protein-domain-containing protein [Nemania sp. FL0916]